MNTQVFGSIVALLLLNACPVMIGKTYSGYREV